jgi:hypothetical protein
MQRRDFLSFSAGAAAHTALSPRAFAQSGVKEMAQRPDLSPAMKRLIQRWTTAAIVSVGLVAAAVGASYG